MSDINEPYEGPFGGVFEKFVPKVWHFKYKATLHFDTIAGGVPSDPKVAEGWIKSKVKDESKHERIHQAVQALMELRNFTEKEAIEELNEQRNSNGFLRNPVKGRLPVGQLYIEGRQAKAALKEAVSVAVAGGNLPKAKWGETGKGAIGFAAEHIQVMDQRIGLLHTDGSPVTGPTKVIQTFPINKITKQTGIQYTEICENVRAELTVTTDKEFTHEQWATIWVTGSLQGLGASRSQDRGRYNVIGWERVEW